MKLSGYTALFLTLSQAQAFTVAPHRTTSALKVSNSMYFMDEIAREATPEPIRKAPAKKPVQKKAVKGNAAHKNGLFSPAVLAAKTVLGEDTLNKVRGKAIGLHSEVIGNFVDTYDSAFGNAVVQNLFKAIDKNRDDKVDENELYAAFKALGFSWLQEKQVKGIMKRAGGDDGYIFFEQFKQELPKTLRTNLVKLAKKNGGDLGFLV